MFEVDKDQSQPEVTPTETQPAHSPESLPQETAQPPVPPLENQAKKSKKKVWLIGLLFVLVVAGGAAAFVLTSKDAEAPKTTTTQTNEASKESANTNTVSNNEVLYYTEKVTTITPKDCGALSQIHLYRKKQNADPVEVTVPEFKPGNLLSHFAIKKQTIAIATENSCGSTDTTEVMLSTDGGETYTKILDLKLSTYPKNMVTSLSVSDDGTKVLMSLVTEDTPNVVKLYDVVTKKTTDLTGLTKATHLYAYDQKKELLYYGEGCIACDGTSTDIVKMYDLKNKLTSVAYENKSGIGEQVVFNADSTKYLLIRGVEGNGIGAFSPYTIEEIDLATKTATKIVTVTDTSFPTSGYTPDQKIFYSSGEHFYTYEKGSSTELYKASAIINRAVFVSSTSFYLTIGSSNDLFKLTTANKTLSKLLHLDDKSTFMSIIEL